MSATNQEIVLAYRHLHQHLLRAVQYAKPARFTVRDRLRDAFRSSPATAYDHVRIANTLEFLRGATTTAGLEHKVLKNILHVWHEKRKLERVVTWPKELKLRKQAYAQFDWTIEQLNETMGLCIK